MKLSSKPTLREKKRYVYFKVHSKGSLNYVDVRNALFDSVFDLIGELGSAKSNLHLIKNVWNQKQQTGIIRCSHLYVDQIKLAISLIHHIGDEKVVFQGLRVSGTIKGTSKV